VSSPDEVSLDVNEDISGRARYHLVKAHGMCVTSSVLYMFLTSKSVTTVGSEALLMYMLFMTLSNEGQLNGFINDIQPSPNSKGHQQFKRVYYYLATSHGTHTFIYFT